VPALPSYKNPVRTPDFRLTFDVCASDIDPLGHVNNVSYVRWIQDIAIAHSAALGLDFAEYARLGAIFVVRRHEIDYLRPVLLGDAVLGRTWIASVMAAKCVRMTELRRGADPAPVAKATTVWGYVDVKTGRPTRIPQSVKDALGVTSAGEGQP
jgi:acyl-CoA thioester hydrolase